MSASLDQPAPFYSEPGPDMRARTADEVVDELIAVITADRQQSPDEIRAVQRLLSVMQAMAAQKAAEAAAMEGQPMSDETSDFGAMEGTEPVDGSEPLPGQEFA